MLFVRGSLVSGSVVLIIALRYMDPIMIGGAGIKSVPDGCLDRTHLLCGK